jgi:cobalt/nickel transport system permease protein
MKHSYLDKYSQLNSAIHKMDARAKIVMFFSLVIIAVSTPAADYYAFAVYLGILLFLLLLSRLPWTHVLKRSLIVVPFVLMVAIFIPFLKTDAVGGGYNLVGLNMSKSGLLVLWNVVVKSYISVVSLIILSSSTQFRDLMRGFERLRVPSIFIAISSFMYRYLFIVTDEALRMKIARDSRNFSGKWIGDTKVIGHMIATLFLRSYERGERVYMAMASRGYDGTIRGFDDTEMTERDYITAAAIVLVALTTRLFVLFFRIGVGS